MTSNQFGENESTRFRSLLEHVTAQPEYTPDIAAIDLPQGLDIVSPVRALLRFMNAERDKAAGVRRRAARAKYMEALDLESGVYTS